MSKDWVLVCPRFKLNDLSPKPPCPATNPCPVVSRLVNACGIPLRGAAYFRYAAFLLANLKVAAQFCRFVCPSVGCVAAHLCAGLYCIFFVGAVGKRAKESNHYRHKIEVLVE